MLCFLLARTTPVVCKRTFRERMHASKAALLRARPFFFFLRNRGKERRTKQQPGDVILNTKYFYDNMGGSGMVLVGEGGVPPL